MAETDAQARAEAEPNLLMGFIQGGELIRNTRVGFGPAGVEELERSTPERRELRRVFEQCTKSYDFWIDNGLAIVGSTGDGHPQLAEQQKARAATTSSAPGIGSGTSPPRSRTNPCACSPST